jgi:hypothetical protein
VTSLVANLHDVTARFVSNPVTQPRHVAGARDRSPFEFASNVAISLLLRALRPHGGDTMTATTEG